MKNKCNCKSYNRPDWGGNDNEVELKSPFHYNKIICVDKCLVEEVKSLWNANIETVGCCCGHNNEEPYIQVAYSNIVDMLRGGYEYKFNEFGNIYFVPYSLKVTPIDKGLLVKIENSGLHLQRVSKRLCCDCNSEMDMYYSCPQKSCLQHVP